MSKKILIGKNAKAKLQEGVNIIADAVKVTLGPRGRNVMIERPFGDPLVTKDGISVANEVLIPNRVRNMGAQFVKVAASKTNELAGDGTTSATVLTQSIFNQGITAIEDGENPVQLQRGIKLGADLLIEELKKMAISIENTGEELKQIAYISSNSDEEIGNLIGEAYSKVGKEGIITVEQSKNSTTYVELANGMKFGSGYHHPYFVNDGKGSVKLEETFILMSDDKITKFNQQLKAAFDLSIKLGKSLLIIGDVEGQALETCVVNAHENNAKLTICKAPGFGERKRDILEDIAYVTGGKVFGKERGKYFNTLTKDDLGYCESMTSDYHDTILIGGAGSKEMIDFRIEEIKAAIPMAENEYEKKQYEIRIASLQGGIGVIYVGATTPIEMKEKMDRVEDSKNATKAALEEGIVVGGGMALIRASERVYEQNLGRSKGMDIVLTAIMEPFYCIVDNTGEDGLEVLKKVLENPNLNSGYDAKENVIVDDMIKAGIIDPVKVTRIALENAASAAGMLLTTEVTITSLLDRNAPQPRQY
jgi:chaperonin GroEL